MSTNATLPCETLHVSAHTTSRSHRVETARFVAEERLGTNQPPKPRGPRAAGAGERRGADVPRERADALSKQPPNRQQRDDLEPGVLKAEPHVWKQKRHSRGAISGRRQATETRRAPVGLE